MNRIEKLHKMNAAEIATEIIKISAASTWKCRLCYYKDNCNKNCHYGIMRFFVKDNAGKDEEK